MVQEFSPEGTVASFEIVLSRKHKSLALGIFLAKAFTRHIYCDKIFPDES